MTTSKAISIGLWGRVDKDQNLYSPFLEAFLKDKIQFK